MKQVLLFGAGKSATVLIDYLLAEATQEEWELMLVDADLSLAESKINGSSRGKALSFDINDADKRGKYIRMAAIVISMLPPPLHALVAADCLRFSRHLLTASYVDESIKALSTEIREEDILFLCEMGLDPGIDHMSAMKLIDGIRNDGGSIFSFASHCGGLVAPESDDNPWHYKISWNPRNIILAGKSGAHFRENGIEKRLTHRELFTPERQVRIPDLGWLSWYPNRDSLGYEKTYGFAELPTFVRTTLRHPEFMSGWQHILDLQLTDETPRYNSDGRTVQDVFRQHLADSNLPIHLNSALATTKLQGIQVAYLGLLDDETIVNKGLCSAADLLQFVVERKLALQEDDKDLIVMLHEIGFEKNGSRQFINSSLVVKGENRLRTAMAKTVGLPLGIAAKKILNGEITSRGLQIPTLPEIYNPVLEELEKYDISFNEERANV